MAARLGEFQRIARFFAPLAAPEGLGLVDDVALIDGPPGEQYVLKTDAIVENVHFLPDDPPRQIAQKLLRVNLSDLAAKGARPYGYLLMTALRAEHDEAWLAEFAAGLAADQKEFGIALMGGDSVSTPGAATLSVAALGRIARGTAVLRRGAKPGDAIFVSGTLGDAALGLMVAKGGLKSLAPASRDFLLDRFRLPQPRVSLGPRLVGIATAMMDISDGLVADLGHLCEVSAVAAKLEAAKLPLSPAARAAVAAEGKLRDAVLGGGDDYELLFTAPLTSEAMLATLAGETGVAITMIGRIETGQGVHVLDEAGREIAVGSAGYAHF
jgi:thiamine-monophosphate kinase